MLNRPRKISRHRRISGRALLVGIAGWLAVAAPRAHGQAPIQRPTDSANPTASAPVAQSAAPERLAFDVASVKLDKSGSGRHSISTNLPGGRLRAINVSALEFMSLAYQVIAARIVGAPPWFNSAYFDIDATADDDTTTPEQNQVRMQALLADRFKLAMHRETRQLPVFALVLVNREKLGPQLHLDEGKCDSSRPRTPPASSSSGGTAPSVGCGSIKTDDSRSGSHIWARSVSMEKFLSALAGPTDDPHVDRPIFDRTGLNGPLDFTLDFAPTWAANTPAADQSALPSFFTALREQLGLELKPETGPVDVIVIDHVEMPSEN
jgi:uncharacterized protein (TIGR03435 family)